MGGQASAEGPARRSRTARATAGAGFTSRGRPGPSRSRNRPEGEPRGALVSASGAGEPLASCLSEPAGHVRRLRHETRDDAATATPPTVDDLLRAIETLTAEAQDHPVTMGEVIDRLGDTSFSLVCILVCLPFLQPFNLGPIAGLGAVHFAALGWQLWSGRRTPWVPARLRAVALSGRTWRRLLGIARGIIRLCSRMTRVRYTEWTSGPQGQRVCGGLLMLGGVLLGLPFPGLPFSNTLPVLIVLSVCIADLEEDGVFVAVALVWVVLSLVYFAFILWTLSMAGGLAFDWAKQWL